MEQQSSVRKSKIRYIILGLSALVLFGNNYSFDNPQSLQKQIMQEVHVTITEYNMLYSIFSLPNIFLTLAGGFLIDHLGGRNSILLFTTMVTLSQLIVAIGGWIRVFWVMLLGRALFGVASENLIIAQNVIITAWFKGNELSTATGIITTLPEISSALNSFFSPLIYEYTQTIAYPLFTSVFVCIFSLICAGLLTIFDQMGDKDDLDDSQFQRDRDEKASLRDLKQLPSVFWYLVLICTLMLGIYIPFMDDISDFYQEKFGFSTVFAGRLIMIPYLLSAVLSPLIGQVVDKVGNRRFFLMVTCLIFIAAQILFGSLSGNSTVQTVIPLVFQGLAFALYSCVMIPCIQYVVDQRIMGTAFGILGMMESIVLSLFPLLAAEIVARSDTVQLGYKNMSLFYAIIGLLGLFLSISLYHNNQSMKLDFVDPNNPKPHEIPKSHEYSMIVKQDEI